MDGDYYNLPFSPNDIWDPRKSAKCDLEVSIGQHLKLIIATQLGEKKFDPAFGCEIWEDDFKLLKKDQEDNWRGDIETSIKDSIDKYETRLQHVRVKANHQKPEEFNDKITDEPKVYNRMKRFININITGKIKGTKLDFSFHEQLYFSPLSLD